MPPPDDPSTAAAFDRIFADRAATPADATGVMLTVAGERVLGTPQNFDHAFRHVLQTEKPGVWSRALARCGTAQGRKLAESLDREFAALGQPALGELPLETCVGLIERHFATQGWGLLQIDLTDAATFGFVVARLDHSYFVETLPDADHFTDALLAGHLQGFFEHVSGQQLACAEIGCARRGAPHCTFVIAAPEQLTPVIPLVGRTPPDGILAKLRS
jgi:predicted hydrocarbon binding protein